MDFETYYRENAIQHGTGAIVSDVTRTGHLPERPSGPDWAVLWALRGLPSRPPNAAMLDVGCAQLTLLRSAESLFTRRVGVDIAPYEQVWSEHPEIETHLHNLDTGPLPFADETFDFVTMLMVLEHVFNPFHAVRELRRVARENADIVLHVPNIAGVRHRFTLLMGRLPITSSNAAFDEESWDGQHIHQFTRDSLTWLLLREGLEPLEWAVTGRFAHFRSRWPSALGSDLVVRCRRTTPRRGMPLDF